MIKKLTLICVLTIFASITLCSCSANLAADAPPLGADTVIHAAEGDAAASADAPASGTELGSFLTAFGSWPTARAHNIGLASKKINGIVLQPGEGFSFNETIGPATAKTGYKKAMIFVKGKEEKGYGGGICQVSSTLFNACDFAGLEITERHDHSKEVSYVEKGRDAATSYGGIDLKFTNSKPYPVKIVSETGKNAIVVKIVAL